MSIVSLPHLRAGRRGANITYGGAMNDMKFDNGADYSPPINMQSSASMMNVQSGFLLPAVMDPAEYCRTNLKIMYDEDNSQTLKFEKGTTTLAFIYQNGIIVAVDSRSTMGPFIASQKVKKINEINEYILATIAGGAADCQFWQRNLSVQCRMFELRNRHRISVRAASKLIANTCNYYKQYGMSLGMMMMGYDNGKPTLYYVDDEGSRMRASDKTPRFSVGSGSTYAYGILDSNWRWDLTDEEAIALGRKAIYHATHRDAYSGGICNVYMFKEDGYRHVVSQDVDEMHDHSKDPQ
uniref:Proteasome subunit beta n=1 Tax=Albugo laibachii Nc14 TaxID=890382 RepID=F0WZU0_9STRA|nr:proteasome subunit beta type5 putative [Albugo laibachii Nc14]|eukprot:CCA27017.1 proteasome subunit beta type5 putative [Albugo laibachii Nc14]